mgnify:CR=1 FL=1
MNNYSFLCIRLKRKQKGFDMNKFIIILTTLLTLTTATKAMSYSQAREQALFLTDKMAYELNLNEEQYDAAYEVNLDYLMSINTYDDLYGTYWTQRNLELHSARLAIQGILRRNILLPPALLDFWSMALCNLRPLSTTRLLLLQPSDCIHIISRRPQLAP